MPKSRQHRQLRDAYRFPGFVPMQIVHGVFGNPLARVVDLCRRQKKQPAEFVAHGIGVIMITSFSWCVTCPVANCESTCHWT
jgi:hypothetical protein